MSAVWAQCWRTHGIYEFKIFTNGVKEAIMNKQIISKTKLSLALALALGTGMATNTAQAVTLDNNDRLGDAGIFQYYTVNGGWQTFIRLINTSADAVSVKVRFREAHNSREVFDFIIFLSPYDMWAGWTDLDAGWGAPGVKTSDD